MKLGSWEVWKNDRGCGRNGGSNDDLLECNLQWHRTLRAMNGNGTTAHWIQKSEANRLFMKFKLTSGVIGLLTGL